MSRIFGPHDPLCSLAWTVPYLGEVCRCGALSREQEDWGYNGQRMMLPHPGITAHELNDTCGKVLFAEGNVTVWYRAHDRESGPSW